MLDRYIVSRISPASITTTVGPFSRKSPAVKLRDSQALIKSLVWFSRYSHNNSPVMAAAWAKRSTLVSRRLSKVFFNSFSSAGVKDLAVATSRLLSACFAGLELIFRFCEETVGNGVGERL